MSVELSPKDRSLKQVLSDVRTDAGLLVRQEIALAKAEVKERAVRVAKQAALFGVAGLVAYAGLLALVAAIVLAVAALGVVAWLAALLVAALVLLGAFVLFKRAGKPEEPSRT
jgi:Putative Actinobacterial Holin-X, holin superfamily III